MMSHPTRSRVTGALLLIGALLLLGACAAGPNELVDTGPDPAGFWLGLWQGLISPITFIVSLFTSSVNIYEVQNNGNWYDFGFMLGVACALGSGGGAGASGSAAYAEAQPRLDSWQQKEAGPRDEWSAMLSDSCTLRNSHSSSRGAQMCVQIRALASTGAADAAGC
jgi:hypothetical protein